MPHPSNTGYLGVHFDANRSRFRVSVPDETGLRMVFGGYYQTAEEAARRYDELYLQIHGEHRLNFPPKDLRNRRSNTSGNGEPSPQSDEGISDVPKVKTRAAG
jgi:hypothetical protein